MTSHRPSPETLSATYNASRSRMSDLAAGISPEAEQLNVATCPAWNVRNLVAHNVGLATDLSSGNMPGDDLQAWIDGQVADRAETPVDELLDEWATSGPAFEALLLERPQLAALVVDVVTHEHDLAGALGLEGDRTSADIALIYELKRGAVEADLVANDLAAIKVVTDGGTWQYGEGDVELEVRGSLWEMFRLTGGRRSMSQLLASDHDGDIARFAPGLVHNPLPTVDIIE